MIRELLMLPLRAEEEAFWEDYTLKSLEREPASVAMDTLLIKWVNQGRYMDAIHLDRRATHHQRSIAFLKKEHEAYSRAVQRRRTLMEGVWALLPGIQREALLAQDVQDKEADEGVEANDVSMDMDEKEGTTSRPHTPLSVSLSAHGAHQPTPTSPSVRLLRASIHMPTAATSRSSPQRHTFMPSASNERPRSMRNDSPFSNWKQVSMPSAAPPLKPQESSGWSVPVPSADTRDVVMDTAALPEGETDALQASTSSRPRMSPSPEVGMQMDDDVLTISMLERAPSEVPHDDDEAVPEEVKPEPPRRRTTRRRAASKAQTASRQHTDPEPGDVSLPGSFPAEDDAPSASSAPAPMSQHSQKESTQSKSVARRSRRRTRATSSGLDDIAGASSQVAKSTRRSTRASAVREETAYPQQSLARLEALHDQRPIARRTRAQTAELESHGSQLSLETLDEDDAEQDLSLSALQPGGKQHSASPVASTPQPIARATRSRRATQGTSRSRRRGSAAPL